MSQSREMSEHRSRSGSLAPEGPTPGSQQRSGSPVAHQSVPESPEGKKGRKKVVDVAAGDVEFDDWLGCLEAKSVRVRLDALTIDEDKKQGQCRHFNEVKAEKKQQSLENTKLSRPAHFVCYKDAGMSCILFPLSSLCISDSYTTVPSLPHSNHCSVPQMRSSSFCLGSIHGGHLWT